LFHAKSKKAEFLSFGGSYQKRAPGGVMHRAKNPFLVPKIQKMQKVPQIF